MCVDTYDSYYCTCREGYQLAPSDYNCPSKSWQFPHPPYDFLLLPSQSAGFIGASICSWEELSYLSASFVFS